jgi:hypothetical protein
VLDHVGLRVRQAQQMSFDAVIVDDVLVVRQTDLGWLCEIESRPTFLGTLQVAPGTSMPREGQRGPITLTLAAALDLGLSRRRLGA